MKALGSESKAARNLHGQNLGLQVPVRADGDKKRLSGLQATMRR
jgi:hypothetical protein